MDGINNPMGQGNYIPLFPTSSFEKYLQLALGKNLVPVPFFVD